MNDDFGDRMKRYERLEAGRKLMPLLPVLARIDGRAFHNFTKGMERPFDERFSAAMIETTQQLVKETGACMGYTQSDEISLAWYADSVKSQIFFDGKIAKMTSQLSALATLYFYRQVLEKMPEYADRLPTFDARVWSVPNLTEGANVFLWRELDATKNSVSMAASSFYSHKTLMGKSNAQKQTLLHDKGINWNNYPAHFKRGTYIQRRMESTVFTAEDLAKLPPKHAAHKNPGLEINRTVCSAINMPSFGSVTNRVEVVFNGATPIVSGDRNAAV